jgi:predicted glycosyltransferase
VWVYGDPDLFDVREQYALPRTIANRVRYLGYLTPHVTPQAPPRHAPTSKRSPG